MRKESFKKCINMSTKRHVSLRSGHFWPHSGMHAGRLMFALHNAIAMAAMLLLLSPTASKSV